MFRSEVILPPSPAVAAAREIPLGTTYGACLARCFYPSRKTFHALHRTRVTRIIDSPDRSEGVDGKDQTAAGLMGRK